MTNTYGRDRRFSSVPDPDKPHHPHAFSLHYEDVQAYLKRVRHAGFKFSYIAVGEFGDLKGRAHWHLIQFWKNRVPDYRTGMNWQDRFWKAGHVFAKPVDHASICYVTSYLYPDPDNAAYEHYKAQSTGNPLGSEYFRRLARQYVEANKSPQSGLYTFPEVRIDKGQHLASSSTST